MPWCKERKKLLLVHEIVETSALNVFKSFFRELSMLHAKCNVSKDMQEHACQKGHAKECAFGVTIFERLTMSVH